jgi:hypothetical protein
MPVSDNQVRFFTEDMLKMVADKNSPDVTLLLFQAIEANPSVKPRYEGLTRADSRVNARIGKMVKEILNRENDREIRVKPSDCKLIGSYMRFKPR